MPGAVTTYGTSGPTSFERSTYNSDTPNFNGNRAQANNYTLDGIDMNETYNNLISYSPAPEALQEIKVITADSANRLRQRKWRRSGQHSQERHQSVPRLGLRLRAGLPLQRKFLFQRANVAGYADQSVLVRTIRGQHRRPDPHETSCSSSATTLDRGGTRAGLEPQAPFPTLCATATSRRCSARRQSNPALRSGEQFRALYKRLEGVPINNPVAKFLFAHPQYLSGLRRRHPATPAGGKCLSPSGRHCGQQLRGTLSSATRATTRATSNSNTTSRQRQDDRILFDLARLRWIDAGAGHQLSRCESLSHMDCRIANWVHTFSPLWSTRRAPDLRAQTGPGFPTGSNRSLWNVGQFQGRHPFPNQRYNGFSNQGLNGNMSDVGTSAYNGGIIDNTYTYSDNLTWQRGQALSQHGRRGQALPEQLSHRQQRRLPRLAQLQRATSRPILANGSGGYGPADFVLDRVSVRRSHSFQRQRRPAPVARCGALCRTTSRSCPT
jgi:hypothetical protein